MRRNFNDMNFEFSDEPVKIDSLFRLVSESGKDVPPGTRGMLLYKGGGSVPKLL